MARDGYFHFGNNQAVVGVLIDLYLIALQLTIRRVYGWNEGS